MRETHRTSLGTEARTKRYGRGVWCLALFFLGYGCGESDAPSAPVGETQIPSLVSLAPSAVTFSAPGQTRQLVATVIDQNGDTISAPDISWTAQDSSIASVSATGLVTAHGAGPAQITAASGFAEAAASIQVQISALGTLQPLVAGLEYPKGLWVSGGDVYVTETAGHNTSFGGNERLLRFSLDTEEVVPLLETWADAVAVAADGSIYLASWRESIPGEVGMVSVVDPASLTETGLLDLGVAATDLFLDVNDDLYVTGTSRQVAAPSLTRLPAALRSVPDTLEQGLRLRAVTQIGADTYLSQFDDTGGGRKIVRRTESGSISEVADDLGAIYSLSSDGTYLYFAAPGAGLIGRFDPSDPTPVVDTVAFGLVSPMTVRYVGATESLYFLTSGTADAEYRDGTLGVISGLR